MLDVSQARRNSTHTSYAYEFGPFYGPFSHAQGVFSRCQVHLPGPCALNLRQCDVEHQAVLRTEVPGSAKRLEALELGLAHEEHDFFALEAEPSLDLTTHLALEVSIDITVLV